MITMTLDECIAEWKSKKRRMGCVSATEFVCKRVPGFYPKRLRRYMQNGNDENGLLWEHVVATDGTIIVDLVPHCDLPDEE